MSNGSAHHNGVDLVHYPLDFQDRNPKKKKGRIAGPVQWVKGWLYLDYDGEDTGDNTLLYEREAENWEVIGNIYEARVANQKTHVQVLAVLYPSRQFLCRNLTSGRSLRIDAMRLTTTVRLVH